MTVHILPTIRRRLVGKEMTIGMYKNWRTELRNHRRLLQRLAQHGFTLATAHQSAIDRYVAEHPPTHSTGVFLNWATAAGLCTKLTAVVVDQHHARLRLSDTDLTTIVDEVFNASTMPLPARLVALFAVIYAQPIQRSVALRRSAVRVNGEGNLVIAFAQTPIRLPDTLERLVREQLDNLDQDHRTLPGGQDWLFPGVMPDQHVSPGRTRDIIAETGFNVRLLKDSRLQHFAQTIPASIIADVTGISVEQATKHSRNAGGTWAGYPASRQGTPDPRE